MFYLVKVLIGRSVIALDRFFDYYSFDDSYHAGMRVLVPFGNSASTVGFVLEEPTLVDSTPEEYAKAHNLTKLVKIKGPVDDFSILSPELIKLAYKMKDKYKADLIKILDTFFPPSLKPRDSALNKPQARYAQFVKIVEDANVSLTKKEAELFEKIAASKDGIRKSRITAKKALEKLLEKKAVVIEDVPLSRIPEMEIANAKPFDLTLDQQKAYEEISNSDKPVLLYGVTGSGKTEVYLKLAEECVRQGKGVLILVPEIILTDRMSELFSSYFKESISVLHSSLSDARKYDEYRRLIFSESRIVLGTRSAIFAPVQNLGLIIIDEEHSSSYKQDNTPFYDAITVASMRKEIEGAKVVLGSATPRIIDMARADRNIYQKVTMDKRYSLNQECDVSFIDMNDSKNLDFNTSVLFSIPLQKAIEENLNKHQQTMLLINRRGYSPIYRCSNCLKTIKCPNCNIPLSYHKRDDTLRCHHCGYQESTIDLTCECGGKEFTKLGYGTERTFVELKSLFPNAKIHRLDSDVSSNRVRHEVLEEFAEGDADIIVGTQIIAKGHDFPRVTLAAVLDADTSITIPSYMANENTFDLISQFAGRAGRANLKGKVIIQTTCPQNRVLLLAAKQDYDTFYQLEMEERKKYQYPPYVYLVNIVIKGFNKNKVADIAYDLKNMFVERLSERKARANIYGPSIPYIPYINGRYYRQILIKYKVWEEISPILDDIKTIRLANEDVDILIDIDPGGEAI